MILTGNKAKLQIGKETTFAAEATPTVEYAFLSEGIKENREKKSEGVLISSKGEPQNITTKISVEGSFGVLARPDDIGHIIGGALGAEATVKTIGTSGYEHTFTAIATGETDSLPSYTIVIDRIADIFQYIGCKIESFKLSGAAGDFIKVDVNIVGQAEEVGAETASLTKSTLKPFLFSGGSLTFGSTEVEITSVDLEYKNGLKNDIQTNITGLYVYEPQPSERQISINCEMLFDDTSLEQYASYYKTDTTFALELEFVSSEEIETGLAYSMKITIPAVQIVGTDFNVKGKDTLKHIFEIKAVDNGTNELITIVLINKKNTKYV